MTPNFTPQESRSRLIENPWVLRQTESHLIFGIFYKRVPFLYPAALAAAAIVAWMILNAPKGDHLDPLLQVSMYGFSIYVLARFAKRQQAVIGWITTKAVLLLCGFLFITVLTPMNIHAGKPDTWPDLALGLVWIPSIEFVPSVTPHQRYVTIARALLTIPCIYFGIKSGNWHW